MDKPCRIPTMSYLLQTTTDNSTTLLGTQIPCIDTLDSKYNHTCCLVKYIHITLGCTYTQQDTCCHFSHQPLVAVPPPLPTVAKAFARAVATTVVTCCETAVASACELPPAQQQNCCLLAVPSCTKLNQALWKAVAMLAHEFHDIRKAYWHIPVCHDVARNRSMPLWSITSLKSTPR